MKRFMTFFALLLAAILALSALAQWQVCRLPGGTSLETVMVDESSTHTGCKGMWIVEKQGGMFWVPWDDETGNWEELTSQSEYDAYYPWWMGADEHLIDGTPTTIAATYEGIHTYEYGTSWEPARPPAWNDYYRWHDAAFYVYGNEPYNANHYIVSAVNVWTPQTNTYRPGLYLITDGTAPAAEALPITNTGDHFYQHIYRNLERGDTLYAWWHDEDFAENTEESNFQKITVTSIYPSPDISVVSDFDPPTNGALLNIVGFYQYEDAANVYHQFIIAKTEDGSSNVTWDVWHRQRTSGGFSASGWEKICKILQDHVNYFDCINLFAFRISNAYELYLYDAELGWQLITVSLNDADHYEVISLNTEDHLLPRQLGCKLFQR